MSFPGGEEPSELAQSLSQAALDEISGSTNMAEVTLALTSETDVRKLAGVILGKCRLLSHGDRSTLFLMDEEKREPGDRDLIVRLSERFEIFTEQVLKKLDAVLEMRESVDQLLHRKNTKRSQDAQRKRKERVDAARQRNENPSGAACLTST